MQYKATIVGMTYDGSDTAGHYQYYDIEADSDEDARAQAESIIRTGGVDYYMQWWVESVRLIPEQPAPVPEEFDPSAAVALAIGAVAIGAAILVCLLAEDR